MTTDHGAKIDFHIFKIIIIQFVFLVVAVLLILG